MRTRLNCTSSPGFTCTNCMINVLGSWHKLRIQSTCIYSIPLNQNFKCAIYISSFGKYFLLGDEAAQMKVSTFESRPNWNKIHNKEILQSLSNSELELCKQSFNELPIESLQENACIVIIIAAGPKLSPFLGDVGSVCPSNFITPLPPHFLQLNLKIFRNSLSCVNYNIILFSKLA